MSRSRRCPSPHSVLLFALGPLLLCGWHPARAETHRPAPGTVATARTVAPAADPPEPPPADRMPDGSLTNDHVARARDLFTAGQFKEAAEILRNVIAFDPKPIHLFNLGQSQRRASQISEARQSYQRFVDMAPDHPSVREARSYIRELDSIEAQVQAAERRYRAQLDRTRSELLSQVAALRGEKPVYKRAWFWVVMGGTLTLVAAGGILAGVLATQKPEPPPTDTGYIGFSF